VTDLTSTSDQTPARAAIADWLRLISRQTVWLALLALVIIMSLISDTFLTSANILNVMRQVTIVGLVSLGMTVVLIGSNFDLSTGATVTLAAVVSVNLQPTTPGRTVLAIVIPLGLGLLVGVLNGSIIGMLRANSIIVTVGTQFFILGATLIYIGGQHVWVWEPTPFYENISGGHFLGIPNPVYIYLVLVGVTHFLLTRTAFGRYVMAIGNNDEAARLSGIQTNLSRMLTFVFAGLTAAVAGIVLASRVKNLDPTAGIGYEFIALTAVVLGGTKLTGGRGNVLNTLAGVLILGVISNSMTLLNLSFNMQLLVRGVILLAAVAVDARSQRVSQ
jgi:ribose/xylose/arabinose/galactoside ABC-type transport system permease subunit